MKNEEKIKKILEEFEKDLEWIEKNYKEIYKKYKGKWIAVKNEKIVACNKDFEKLWEKLKEIKCEDALIRYIHTKIIIPSI